MEVETRERKIDQIEDYGYENMKKGLKKKKAPDQQRCRYEWVECAGRDLEESIKFMLNKLIEEKEYPMEWKHMEIKSISKDNRKKMEMEYRRGLFLTNILSKCMEKILLNRRVDVINQSMSPFQCGGVKGRSIGDNLFIVNTIINEFRERKQNLYILFTDLEKCFDKLNLKDCIFELTEAGVPVEEAMYIYGMNTDVVAEVNTPLGKTEKFKINEVVRQGTIYGPTLCAISTDRINKMKQQQPTVIGDIEIKCPVYVDDIVGMGSRDAIESLGRRMDILEKTKKFVFNNKKDKTEIMVMKNSRKEEVEELEIKVGKGRIERTKEYKYLGDVYNEEGNNKSKIRKRMEKAKHMAYEVRRMGHAEKLGNADMDARFVLLEATVKPSLLANTETWMNITKDEEKMIEKGHYEVLRIVFEQKANTPYYGIISETGIWPYLDEITYKKLMFLHYLIHSDEERIARKLLMNQVMQKGRKNWYNELEEKAREIGIELDIEKIKERKKSEWKREVKQRINERIEKVIQEKAEKSTKLRFLKGNKFEKEEYLQRGNAVQCSNMKLRLNMIEAKANYKNIYKDLKCIACGDEEESTEHIVRCRRYKELARHNLQLDEYATQMKETEWLLEAVKAVDRIEEVREIINEDNWINEISLISDLE